jgi:hypothetical protein
VAGCCECGDEPSGSCATELVIYSNYSDAETKTVIRIGNILYISQIAFYV